MQHDSSMAIGVSYPVRRSPCCVKRNVRYGSQGTHRENVILQNYVHDSCMAGVVKTNRICPYRISSKQS